MAVQEEENVLKLFDSYWFQNSIFTNRNPCHQIDEKEEIEKEEEEPLKLSRLPTLHIRSMSDHVLTSQTSFTSDNSHSPTTVLSTAPRLQPILSGKEVGDFVEPGAKHEEMILEIPIKKKVSGTMGRRRRRRRKASSRSLSELEFEELKGFMDLGFVFSEEDKDSRLVSIIPGLQRLGRKGSGAVEKEEDDGDDDQREDEVSIDESDHVVSRPYLSEAWDVLDQEKPFVLDWRIPAMGNEVDMKLHLKSWAHSVASAVK